MVLVFAVAGAVAVCSGCAEAVAASALAASAFALVAVVAAVAVVRLKRFVVAPVAGEVLHLLTMLPLHVAAAAVAG